MSVSRDEILVKTHRYKSQMVNIMSRTISIARKASDDLVMSAKEAYLSATVNKTKLSNQTRTMDCLYDNIKIMEQFTYLSL